MNIGILYICTGKYTIFWKDFYLTMEQNFVNEPGVGKHYFVFTDAESIDFETENPNIHRIYQQNLGWPNNTLMRFDMFLGVIDQLNTMDYLFFFNANLRVLEAISSEEFLPEKGELLACLHPGFFDKPRSKFTYETNPQSTAYIQKGEGEHYYAGGIMGGSTDAFLNAIKTISNNIHKDHSVNIVALWHDESHWNRYLIGKTNVRAISPAYLYPEGWKLPFRIKILLLDKQKFGGHDQLRGSTSIARKIVAFTRKCIRKVRNILQK